MVDIGKQKIPVHRVNQILFLINKLHINNGDNYRIDASDLEKLAIFNEALTHTSAQLSINYERLEFLGDAVLRLAASEFIDRRFPAMDVGDRSALRAQLVSDQWLSEIGNLIKIEEFLLMGQKASKDNSAKRTLAAESTEALIGAIFESFNSLKPIHNWLTPFWEESSVNVLSDPHKKNSKSAFQEWSQGLSLGLPKYECIEKSQKHGDPERFFCKVSLKGQAYGEGWGRSRQDAEKEAALNALNCLDDQ